MAVHKEVLESSAFEYPSVNPTNIGTVPIGFRTENKAANKSKKTSNCFFYKDSRILKTKSFCLSSFRLSSKNPF